MKLLCNEEQVGLIGQLETKMKSNKIDQPVEKLFGGWQYVTSLAQHYNGRIWITWRQDYYHVVPATTTAQVITC